jgi:ligand-binding sensor protein
MNSERETILTLKDVDILDEKYEDVLVNVNIVDTERTKAGNNSRAFQDWTKNISLTSYCHC